MLIRRIAKASIVLSVIFSFNIFAQSITYQGDMNSSLVLTDNIMVVTEQFGKSQKTYNITRIKKDGFDYITDKETGNQWLALISEELVFLYDNSNTSPVFRGINKAVIPSAEHIIYFRNFEASSFLIEYGIQYLPNNLGTAQMSKPWVEGVKGDGIGEFFFFQKPIPVEKLYISNGYVSMEKPNLFYNNNRVKKIQITDTLDPHFNLIISLQDTPNPQKIDLGSKVVRQLKFTILETYKGIKWDDTCLNFVLLEL